MMKFFKKLSHEAKVILSVLGTAAGVLISNPEMLTTIIAQPWSVALPLIIPKLVAPGAIGGALYNMLPKKTDSTEVK